MSGFGAPPLVRGQVLGTATNDDAAAGYVGEYISSTILTGAEVALTANTPTNVTSISLTAGDWDVEGLACWTAGSGTQAINALSWVSSTSASIPTKPNAGAMTQMIGLTFTNGVPQLPTGSQRVSLSATTTLYLSVFATFSVSTLAAYGFLGARRRR
jgi:hypothetical protein